MFFTNRYLTPAVKKCSVQKDADFPTHKPVLVEVESASVNKETRQLHTPTDFSQLFEEKAQRERAEEHYASKIAEARSWQHIMLANSDRRQTSARLHAIDMRSQILESLNRSFNEFAKEHLGI